MRTLGYIVTDRKIKGVDGFITQIKALDEAISPLPILIVGWENAKAHSGYKSVIEKRLDERTYWTFKKTECRSEFEKDLNEFCRVVVEDFVGKLTYNYVSPTSLSRSRIKKLLVHVNSAECGCIYLSDGMVYIPMNGHVIGLSLRVLEYCGASVEKIVSLLRTSGKLVTNRSIEDKSVFKWFNDKKYAMAYMVCGQ